MAVALTATSVRILGIDPGSRCMGIGVIDASDDGRIAHVFHCAVEIAIEPDNFSRRLKQIFEELNAIIARWRPNEVAIERVFMSKNADSALKLGQARGAAICAVVSSQLDVVEYSPSEIKQAVVGTGGADKTQVQHMVGVLLSLEGKLQADAADALAVAMAHAHTRATVQRIGIPRALWRRR